MTDTSTTAPAVLTERRGSVLLITLNRPESATRSTPRLPSGIGGGARRARRRRRRSRVGILTGAGRASSRRHGPRGVRQRASRRSSGTAASPGIAQRAAAQAAHRGHRGLRGGRRLRDRARLRPDRRRAGASSASPRSSARSSPPPARCCACPAGSPTTWHGARAHRRPDDRRALRRARRSSTVSPSPARRSTPRWSSRPDRGQRPARACRLQGSIVERQFDWSTARDVGSARPRSPARSSPPRTRTRARPRSTRSATRSGAGASPSSPQSVASSRRPPPVAGLAQVDPLPRAEREPAVGDRQAQRRPQQRRLDVGGHVVGALERVRPAAQSSGTAAFDHASKSRRTSGEAFSLSVSPADVWRMNRCSRPTRSSPSSGSAPTTSSVTRWKPRGRGRSSSSRWIHKVGQSCHAQVDARAVERDALPVEQRALALAFGQRAVGAHDPVPGHLVPVGAQHLPREARGAPGDRSP